MPLYAQILPYPPKIKTLYLHNAIKIIGKRQKNLKSCFITHSSIYGYEPVISLNSAPKTSAVKK